LNIGRFIQSFQGLVVSQSNFLSEDGGFNILELQRTKAGSRQSSTSRLTPRPRDLKAGLWSGQCRRRIPIGEGKLPKNRQNWLPIGVRHKSGESKNIYIKQ
jgi:hypothetical protein